MTLPALPRNAGREDAERARFPRRSRLARALVWATVGALVVELGTLVVGAATFGKGALVVATAAPALIAVVGGAALAWRAFVEKAAAPRLTAALVMTATIWVACTIAVLQGMNVAFNYGESTLPNPAPRWLDVFMTAAFVPGALALVASVALFIVRAARTGSSHRAAPAEYRRR
ncbi:hypothetical protein [Frondihabitans australicus]|uniref:Uncharacterized protein n=1 Tax=Frondihabitans australicus TaxID=386892 RepID=A0A495IER0_9MICO|nr:hypothetical protein [Frondihabitans australicus]RKR73988.1 hypothetical protein C8E83_1089 [Frondihabitans australicus]